MHFLFVTLQHVESQFYGDVALDLKRRGHRVSHVTFSRRSAATLNKRGMEALCLPDLMSQDPASIIDVAAEVTRIEATYATPTLRDIYRSDYVCNGRPEAWSVLRTIRHVRALERVIDGHSPDVVIPEVGNETLRTVSHLVALQRNIPVLFLFYTIFDDPLRLYVDDMHRPIVAPEHIHPLSAEEQATVADFVARFKARDKPIREYRKADVTLERGRLWLRHVVVRLLYDRDNEYLRPAHWLAGQARERVRTIGARRFYSELTTERPFAYFPLHVVDDYKIKRVIPHCADQAAIIELVARSLPHGHDLVVKEHPMAIGRTPPSLLRRLRRLRNVRVVAPHTSSHELIQRARAVVVISSTVGLEALLYGKPVLTIGEPFYSGCGITVDATSFAEIREKVPQTLAFSPSRERIEQFLFAAMSQCYPGAPALVDRSSANAARLATSLEQVAAEQMRSRARTTLAAVPGSPVHTPVRKARRDSTS